MSIFRTVVVLGAVVMLLPAEDTKQAEFSRTAAGTAQQAATYCERNPSTCGTAREAWSLFLRKAEYGVELGAKMLRDQLLRSSAEQPVLTNASDVYVQPARVPGRADTQAAVARGYGDPVRFEPRR